MLHPWKVLNILFRRIPVLFGENLTTVENDKSNLVGMYQTR